jgi:hypothetical protein
MNAVVDTIDTQSASLKAVGVKGMAKSLNEIYEVVRVGIQRGAQDMSLTEIRDLYEHIHDKRIDLNRVSARVSNLIAAQRLERRLDTRQCSVSKRLVHPVFIPLKQVRLCA